MLKDILSSKIRSEIFRLLFDGSAIELHNREIVRRAGLGETGIRRELHKLEKLDLIKRRTVSNRAYYMANTDHPLYNDIKNIVIKTVGLLPILYNELNIKGVTCAFIFGSFANGHIKAESDVDLIVIGSIGLRKLSHILQGIIDKINREINPHVFTQQIFKKRLKENDHFITSVMDSKKVFIIGFEDELKAMV